MTKIRGSNRFAVLGSADEFSNPVEAARAWILADTYEIAPRREAAQRCLGAALLAVDRRELPVVRHGKFTIRHDDETVVLISPVSAGVNPSDPRTDATLWAKARIVGVDEGSTLNPRNGALEEPKMRRPHQLFASSRAKFRTIRPNEKPPALIEKEGDDFSRVAAVLVGPQGFKGSATVASRSWVPRLRGSLRKAGPVSETPPAYDTCWKTGQELVQEAKVGFPGTVVLQNIDLFTRPAPVDIAKLTTVVDAWYTAQGSRIQQQKAGECTNRASHLGRVLNKRGLPCLKVWLYPEQWSNGMGGWEFHVFLAARDASGKWYGIDPWWASPGVLPMAEMLTKHATEGIVGIDVSSREQPFPLAFTPPVNGNPEVAAVVLQQHIARGHVLLPEDAWVDDTATDAAPKAIG
jgi:hypothetical protein